MKTEASGSTDFLTHIKNFFTQIIDKLKNSNYMVIDLVIAFGFGFLVGFLVKKFSQLMLLLTLFIIGLIILQQFDLISVSCNVSQVQSILGVKHVPTSVEFLPLCWTWIKIHAAVSISFVIGIILGLNLA